MKLSYAWFVPTFPCQVLILFLVFLPGGARRSFRVDDSRDGMQQQARVALIPGGLRTRIFRREGLQANASSKVSMQDAGGRAADLEPLRGAPWTRSGPRRGNVALQEAGGSEEGQSAPQANARDGGRPAAWHPQAAGTAAGARPAPLQGVPRSADEMMQRAAAAVKRAKDDGALRLVVKVVVPDDTRMYKVFGAVPIQGTSAPEDLDPWPGGLRQQYPIALGLGRQLLSDVTGASERMCTDQLLDAEDACGLILAQSETPADDAACVLFAGSDQMDQLAKVEGMVGDKRLLCLLNPQFRRLEDFSFWQREKAKNAYFDRGYQTAFAFEELACRGEDVKLVGEYGRGWRAYVYLDDQQLEGIALHDEDYLSDRPEYAWLEQQINARHPSPRWARQLDKVDAEGLRFMRGSGTDSSSPER